MSELKQWMDDEARELASSLARINLREMDARSMGGYGLRTRAITFLETVKSALFPALYEVDAATPGHLVTLSEERLYATAEQLKGIARDVFFGQCAREGREACDRAKCKERADQLVLEFLQALLPLRELLTEDLRAAYEGDPAARYMEEILLSYPSIDAVSTYRVAHELFVRGLPVVPRILTEYAHTRTGIDIHPGASVGEAFFIDHGTGVVIGETCVIGRGCRLYQGVTLGALSFPKGADGVLIKGIPRHPKLEDDVTVYAGATILGNITIGAGSVIGANTWVTRDVPRNSKVVSGD